VREQRAQQLAERNALSARQTELHSKTKKQIAEKSIASSDDDDDEAIGGALQLARKANSVKKELTKKGQPKSWWKSGLASTALGPAGWLYAGSFRESIPAAAAWLAALTIAGKIIPFFLLFPVLMVVMPLSGIAGVLYALVCAYLHWVGLALAGDAARRLRVKRQHVPPAVRVSAAGILEAASTPGVCGLLVDHGLCD